MKVISLNFIKYVLVSIIVYSLGYIYFLNQTVYDPVLLSVFVLAYFVLLPTLYANWMIKSFKNEWYKVGVTLFISIYIAKISFPSAAIPILEELSVIRIGLLALLILINLGLIKKFIFSMIKALKLEGDPRIEVASQQNVVSQQNNENDYGYQLEMVFASELANWRYCLGKKFTKNHVFGIKLKSNKKNLLATILFIILCMAASIFFSLMSYSITLASFSSLLILYSIPMLIANYRVSKYASVYISNHNLVLNNTILAITVIDLKNIKSIEVGSWENSKELNAVNIGTGTTKNIKITLKGPVIYNGFMGQAPRRVVELRLSTWNNEAFKSAILNKMVTT